MKRTSLRSGRSEARESALRPVFLAVVLLLGVAGAIVPPAAAARAAEESLDAGIAAYQAAEYATAIERFRAATAEPAELAPSRRALAFMYLGAIYTLRGITAEAAPHFDACVAADPNFQPDEEIFNLAQRNAWETAHAKLAGRAEIRSDPSGALVRIDGAPVGQTPFTGWLLLGERRVEIEKPGYRSSALTLQVRSEGLARPAVTALAPTRAILSVEIEPPEALIRIRESGPEGGQIHGEPERGPIRREFPEGDYVVSGELEGFVGESQSVTLKDGERREVRLRLTETPEHALARVDRELRAQAEKIRAGKAGSKTLLSVLCLTGTAAGLGSGIVFHAKAEDSFDAYSAAVSAEEIDSHYSDYESRWTLSRISFGVAGGMLALSVLQLIRGVPSVEEILADLRREKGLALRMSGSQEEGLRIGLGFGSTAVARVPPH